MIYDAILCDDDQIIVEGLKQIIPWKSLNINLCACGYNGKEAKQLIDQFNPSILISDIRMPFVDGIELMKFAREKNPNIKIIVISGYDDFSYAQSALKYGALDYILKPINEQLLIEQLEKAVYECGLVKKQQYIEQQHSKNTLDRMVKTLCFENTDAFIKKFGDNLSEQYINAYCSIMLITIDSFQQHNFVLTDKQIQELNHFLLSSCNNMLNQNIGIINQQMGGIGLYFINSSKVELKKDQEQLVSTLKDKFNQHFKNHSVTFCLSNIHKNIMNFREPYLEAKLILSEKFSYNKGSVIYYDKFISKKNKLSHDDIDSILSEIDFISLIKEGNRNKIVEQLDDLKLILSEQVGKSYLFMTMIVSNLYMNLYKELKKLGIEEDGYSLDLIKNYQVISHSQNIDTLIDNLKKNLFEVLDYMEENSSRYTKILTTAKNFIDNNYNSNTLSIDQVARHVNMSPSYFSMIFKTELGISFTSYLIKIRMDTAKNLLLNSKLSVYEISEKIGYDTAAYFSTAFKKYTGTSPSEYKRKNK